MKDSVASAEQWKVWSQMLPQVFQNKQLQEAHSPSALKLRVGGGWAGEGLLLYSRPG